MSNLPIIDKATATGQAATLLSQVETRLGSRCRTCSRSWRTAPRCADLPEHVRRFGRRGLPHGVTDTEIAETVGHVALNVLTNYFNVLAAVENDWPVKVTLD
ncbi:hypothetical protein [Pseudonocardia spinosispora]|uniref:hypothetical protein n=1 Tax=Pseudonocardia spinosispora TaxID=103441 RepID=UPI000A01C805|nr:hypothetical protein [Pseudonocardia spinosispora]